jgi:hypothetical protein
VKLTSFEIQQMTSFSSSPSTDWSPSSSVTENIYHVTAVLSIFLELVDLLKLSITQYSEQKLGLHKTQDLNFFFQNPSLKVVGVRGRVSLIIIHKVVATSLRTENYEGRLP